MAEYTIAPREECGQAFETKLEAQTFDSKLDIVRNNNNKKENETHLFISLIERYPELYNKKHKDFLRQDRRNQIWDSICKDLSWDDTDKAKKKWRNLRDKFVKKRRIHGSVAVKFEDDHQWEYYNRLLFLDEHVNRRSNRTTASSVVTTTLPVSTTTTTTAVANINPNQYVQVSTNQIPLEHINLEYLSGVNVTEAQCLLDISNNQTTNQHAHPHPHQHQSLAAQHIQQFKIEYPNEEGEYADEEEVVSQCAVEVETVHAIEENSSINSFDGHNVNSAALAGAVAQQANTHPVQPAVDVKTLYSHQYNGSIAMVTTVAAPAPSNTTTAPATTIAPAPKRPRHDVVKNGDSELSEVISAAVDYFKMQTAFADADAAFAKYILEEVRQMSRKRKNEFKRKVTTWLTSEDETTGLE